jgi:hypothetical protein
MTDEAQEKPEHLHEDSGNGSPTILPVAGAPVAATTIQPGSIKKLRVPMEDIAAGITPSEELDLSAEAKLKIGKPRGDEWIRLFRESELLTRLLVHKPNPNSFEEEHYYVDPALRDPIQDAMRDVRVIPFFAVRARAYRLWILKVTPGHSVYESVEPLFSLPSAFFTSHELLFKYDKTSTRYRIRKRETESTVECPSSPTEELLGEALGEDHFIHSVEHSLYRELTAGEAL